MQKSRVVVLLNYGNFGNPNQTPTGNGLVCASAQGKFIEPALEKGHQSVHQYPITNSRRKGMSVITAGKGISTHHNKVATDQQFQPRNQAQTAAIFLPHHFIALDCTRYFGVRANGDFTPSSASSTALVFVRVRPIPKASGKAETKKSGAICGKQFFLRHQVKTGDGKVDARNNGSQSITSGTIRQKTG